MKSAYLLLLLLLINLPDRACAYMVNIQELLSTPITKGWSITGEASTQTYTGNSDIEIYSAEGTVTYKQPRYLLLFTSRREYSKSFGESTSDSYFNHLHSIYRFSRNFGWELFAQQSADFFQRSRLLFAYGTGPRFQFRPVKRLGLAFSVDYMREHESFTDLVIPAAERTDVDADGNFPEDDLVLPPEPDRSTDRFNSMFYVNWRWGKYSSIGNTIYFQPKIGDFNNRKVLNEAYFLLGINGIFSFRFSHAITFNSTPPARVERFDRSFSQSWYITFSRDDAQDYESESKGKD